MHRSADRLRDAATLVDRSKRLRRQRERRTAAVLIRSAESERATTTWLQPHFYEARLPTVRSSARRRASPKEGSFQSDCEFEQRGARPRVNYRRDRKSCRSHRWLWFEESW